MRLQAVIFAFIFAMFSQIVLAQSPQRCIATLDWTVAETLLGLGEQDFCAMGDVKSYQHWVVEPKLPKEMVDLGVRMQPNPEQIYRLNQRPLMFINSSFYASAKPILAPFTQHIATVNFYDEGDAWQNILTATAKVADLIGKPQQSEQLIQGYLQKISQIRPLVKPYTDRPVLLVQFIDTCHLRVYAENSPFGAVLRQLGFRNSWQGRHNTWGFETIEVTQLAKLPEDSRFVVVKPYPTNIHTALRHNTLWQHLTMAKDPLILPAVWTFGAIPSAQRFAEVFANGLQNGGEPW